MAGCADGSVNSGHSSSSSRSRRRKSSRSSSSAMKKRIWSAIRALSGRRKRSFVLGKLEEARDVLFGKRELPLQCFEELDLGGRHLRVRRHDGSGEPESQLPGSLVGQPL